MSDDTRIAISTDEAIHRNRRFPMTTALLAAAMLGGGLPPMPATRRTKAPDPERQAAAQAKRDRKAATKALNLKLQVRP